MADSERDQPASRQTSPTSNGSAEEYANEQVEGDQRAPREIIDLTTEDHVPIEPPIPGPISSGEKRKYDSPNSGFGRPKSRDDEGGFDNPAKRRRTYRLNTPPILSRETRARRTILKIEEIKLSLEDRQSVYLWHRSLKAWKGIAGLYVIGGTVPRNLDFLTCVKVRPKGDNQPIYLNPAKGGDGELFFEGSDINGRTVEVTSGEMRDMICCPEGGPYIGYIVEAL